jgi:anti-anti-sigma factor
VAFEIQRERLGGVLIADLGGRLDSESAADFELFAQETVAAGERHLVLDLSALGYISNAGARVLASLSKSMATPTTSLRVAGVQPGVRQILDDAGVSLLLDLRTTREAALADHPAAHGDRLGTHVLALLGVAAQPAGSPDPQCTRLAELAFDLLGGQQHQHRAAKAIVQGTQVMRRVGAAPITGPARSSAVPPAAPRPAARLPWWKRWLGIKG